MAVLVIFSPNPLILSSKIEINRCFLLFLRTAEKGFEFKKIQALVPSCSTYLDLVTIEQI